MNLKHEDSESEQRTYYQTNWLFDANWSPRNAMGGNMFLSNKGWCLLGKLSTNMRQTPETFQWAVQPFNQRCWWSTLILLGKWCWWRFDINIYICIVYGLPIIYSLYSFNQIYSIYINLSLRPMAKHLHPWQVLPNQRFGQCGPVVAKLLGIARDNHGHLSSRPSSSHTVDLGQTRGRIFGELDGALPACRS